MPDNDGNNNEKIRGRRNGILRDGVKGAEWQASAQIRTGDQQVGWVEEDIVCLARRYSRFPCGKPGSKKENTFL